MGVARISDKCVVASLAYNSSVDLAGVKAVLGEVREAELRAAS